jgi:Family of unknown function (DUF6476)
MRLLKVLVIAMGVLIVVATTVLVVLIARRIGGGGVSTAPSVAVLLEEPVGTRIVGVAAVGDRLAVLLQGGGAADRMVLVDPRSGALVGRIGLRGQ